MQKIPHNLTPTQMIIRELSDRIVAAQKPIRILDAIKWGPEIKEAFFKSGCQTLPPVTAEYYKQRPLPFDIEAKRNEFSSIERDIIRHLGQYSGISRIMQRVCREYRRAIDMLIARGTPEFSNIAIELYGSSSDAFYPGAPVLKDLSPLLSIPLTNLRHTLSSDLDQKRYTSPEAAAVLTERLAPYFKDCDKQIVIVQSDDIVADAAAGASSIKLRRNAMFSERELKILEVHEGWVHVGTSRNGALQPICTFLGKGTPSSTITQEGLAVIMEIITFSSYPERVQRITDRVSAISMAEDGADFMEIFRHLKQQGFNDDASYHVLSRIFRGSLPQLGPFTKDLSYAKGFILIYNYIQLAVQQGLTNHIPLLFVGKTSLEDLHTLLELSEEGLIVPPKHIPPQFSDFAALSAWMCFNLFMNKLDLNKLSSNFKPILHQ